MADLTPEDPGIVMTDMAKKTPKKPAPFSVGEVRCNAVRPPDASSPLWYWRAMRSIGGGRRKTVWTGRATRAEAQRAVALAFAQGDAERPPEPDEVEIVTLKHLLAYYVGAMAERVEAGDLKPRSLDVYRVQARQVAQRVGHVHLDRFDASHVGQYRDRAMTAGRAPQSVRGDISLIRAAWRWGQERGLVDARALGRVKVASKRRVRTDYTPTRAEFWTALDALEAALGERRPDICGVVRLLGATGMRIGEACGLLVEDVDLERATLTVHTGKTPRDVPLAPPAVDQLVEVIGERTAGKLWGGVAAWGLQTATIKALQHAVPWSELGQRRFSAHGIRRMVVIELLSAGVDPAVEARIMGHSVQVALRYYRQVRRDDMDDALARAALGQRQPTNVVPLRRRGGEG